MTTSAAESLLEILQSHFNPREEGWSWFVLYRDDEPGGVVEEITGEYEDAEQTARLFAGIVETCHPQRVQLAVCRHRARPTESDRALWRTLRGLVDADVLVDMVIFGRHHRWSMRSEDASPAMTYEGTTIG
jgi:hypothetical protein